MYEFFLTAIVLDDDVLQARALLQGYCAMPESHQFHRVLFFRGPDRPAGFKKVMDLDKIPNGRAFRELQQYLSKQSYVLQARYPLSPSEFGAAQSGPSQPLDQRPGTMRWSDLPEPIVGDQTHIQRKMLDIPRQDNLLNILAQNEHTIQSEYIEESYVWWRESTEYTLKRDLRYPGDPLPGPPPFAPYHITAPRDSLPPLSDMTPVSSQWILQVRMMVPEARPELSNQALRRLSSIVDDLGTSFAFRQYDRRLFDMRIQASLGNAMPKPLPPVVRVGGRG